MNDVYPDGQMMRPAGYDKGKQRIIASAVSSIISERKRRNIIRRAAPTSLYNSVVIIEKTDSMCYHDSSGGSVMKEDELAELSLDFSVHTI